MLTAKKKEHARFSGKRERFRSPVSQSAQHVTVTHPSPTGSAFLVDSLTSLLSTSLALLSTKNQM